MENKQSLFDENEISINEFVFFLKIVLINKKTNQRSTFVCNEVLIRNDFNLRAEQTFQVEDHESDDEQTTPRNQTSDDDSRPKTRRGRDQQQTDDEQPTNKPTTDQNIWRPPSQLDQNQTFQTDSTASQDGQFKDWYPNSQRDED